MCAGALSDGKIAFADTLFIFVERLFYHYIFCNSAVSLSDRTAVLQHRRPAIYPSYAVAAIVALKQFTQIARQNVALYVRVAIVSNAYRAI